MQLTNEQILEKVQTKIKPDQLICLMRFGSHLYGTSTEASDTDVKGVYIPELEDYLNQSVIKSIHIDSKKAGSDEKNTEEDYDIELFSLNHFIKLAVEGQTVAIDMLYADEKVYINHTPYTSLAFKLWMKDTIWRDILDQRDKFLQKNLNAFVGYAQKQAAKYGLKGSRMDAVKKYLDFFDDVIFRDNFGSYNKLKSIWGQLPKGEYIEFGYCEKSKLKQVEVCNRKLQETVTVQYAYDCLQKVYDGYGKRAKMAQSSEGVDWKAISHCVRASYELIELYNTKNIIFPLTEAKYLLKIKQGKYEYPKIAEHIEHLMNIVTALSEASDFPEKVDSKFWNDWLLKTLKENVK